MKEEKPYTVEDVTRLFKDIWFNPGEHFYGLVTFHIQDSKCFIFDQQQKHKKEGDNGRNQQAKK